MKGSKRGWTEDLGKISDFCLALGILHMLVSYKWLKQLVDVDVPSEELAEKCQQQGSK